MSKSIPPLLELHDAVVKRAGRVIFSVGDFKIEQGENIALLGPNGAGKSTFVKMITREVLPLYRSEAPVKFKGKERAVLADVKKSLGIVSSSMQSQITVHLPAIEVVEGGMFGSLGVPKHVKSTEHTRAKARDAMDMLGISDLENQDIMTMSTGQARRVLVARALVHDPDTLIFDEPCTGLDPEGMFQLRASMRRLAREGKGIVLITHYPEDVIPEIDRIILIKNGEVFADGSKDDLLTSKSMSELFGVPLEVEKRSVPARHDNVPGQTECGSFLDEYFSLVSRY